jgi:OmcA/MtrC family decaheme c-type cytochrome
MIHGIHGAHRGNREAEATAENPLGFGHVHYPAALNYCEACHVAGSYDFSATANMNAVPNLLWSTTAKGNMFNPDPVANPSIGLSPWIDILGNGQVDYTGRANNLVISPIAAACFGCHDSMIAVTHMKQNGAVIYSTGGDFKNQETCLVCHGPGRSAAIGVVHNPDAAPASH